MNSLVNSNFSRTYNPSGRPNALSNIKRLLTSRDTVAQSKACTSLADVISRYKPHSNERVRLVEYLLDNDITVFLCEATSNLDLSLFRSVLSCFRLLWRESRYFAEEHAAYSMTAVLRALAHYSNSGSHGAVKYCLHFLCDLLTGVSSHETVPALSHQSAYSAEQLLACLLNLAPIIGNRRESILSSALVLQALVAYQPSGLRIRGSTASALTEVLAQWFTLLMGSLNHSALVGDASDISAMFYAVICQLGMDVLRLIKHMREDHPTSDLVQRILVDETERSELQQSCTEMIKCTHKVIVELVDFTKENQSQMPSEEYGVFLKFLLAFLSAEESKHFPDFCDMLFGNGYLKMLPQVQIARKDVAIRKVSTLVLGEILKVLAQNHLDIDSDTDLDEDRRVKDIHIGLMELQYGIERPQTLGLQLQQCRPYSLLIYIYFYCQSSDNPEEATAPLLPYLIEHILKLPRNFKPPKYIIKALWLVFSMATISNTSLESFNERILLEQATERFTGLLLPEPGVYYTHNPALLLWTFTSSRIVASVRVQVLSQWLEAEDTLPSELASEPVVWELLLNVLVQSKSKEVQSNAVKCLHMCIEEGDGGIREEFAASLWWMLPGVLSEALIDYERQTETNTCHLLELATTLIPNKVDEMLCVKIAVLLSTIFSKHRETGEDRAHYQYVSLKLALYLLGFSSNQNGNRVLTAYVQRAGFLPSVLTASTSADDRVACAALQLLSYVVHFFTKCNFQPTSILEVSTVSVVKSLRHDSSSERGAALLQLVYTVLNTHAQAPLVMSYHVGELVERGQAYVALRALMFRVQMLCCKESTNQSAAGWKTLGSIFKHAIVSKNDTLLVAKLTTQPWTHTLTHFQLTQRQITNEFLTFLNNWLTLLKITINRNQNGRKITVFESSLITRTVIMLKKYVVVVENDELKDLKERVLTTVQETINDSEYLMKMLNKGRSVL